MNKLKTTNLIPFLKFISLSSQAKFVDVLRMFQRLVRVADFAMTCRQGEVIGQVSKELYDLPLPASNEGVCQYYRALAINNFGKGNANEAEKVLESILDNAPLRYRGKAMVSLGALQLRASQFDEAHRFYSEAQRINKTVNDPLVHSFIAMNEAQLLSIEGDHKGSLRILESILPFMRMLVMSYPNQYYNYLNSLAMELLEEGRIKEALYFSRVALASPYAHAYPEWIDTYNEILERSLRASHSHVTLHKPGIFNNLTKSGIPFSGGDKPGTRRDNVLTLPIDRVRPSNYDRPRPAGEVRDLVARLEMRAKKKEKTDERTIDDKIDEIILLLIKKKKLKHSQADSILEILHTADDNNEDLQQS